MIKYLIDSQLVGFCLVSFQIFKFEKKLIFVIFYLRYLYLGMRGKPEYPAKKGKSLA